MKNKIILMVSLLMPAVARADLGSFQSAITGDNPSFYFSFDNSSLSSSATSTVFTANNNAGFSSDYFGNANNAAYFPGSADYMTLSSPTIISGQGTSTAMGSLTMLFYVPSTIPATGYYFSASETTGGAANGQPANSALALQFSTSALTLKVGNKSYSAPTTVSAGNWYYLALAYNLNGTAAGVNGINYYLGQVGGMLSSAFEQKGGTGNLSTTSTLGDSLGFVLGNKQAAISISPAGSSTAGVAGGEIDEFATYATELSASQIDAQYAVLSVPEPRAWALIGFGTLVLALDRKLKFFRR